jgi:hypothetical protein
LRAGAQHRTAFYDGTVEEIRGRHAIEHPDDGGMTIELM